MGEHERCVLQFFSLRFLILLQRRPIPAWLLAENRVHEHQEEYYSGSSRVDDQTIYESEHEQNDTKGTSSSHKIGDSILNLYEVRSEPYLGGMGSAVKVHHTTWNVDLAMKQPQADFSGNAKKEIFTRECEAWINLGLHPNIVACYYVRNVEGVPSIFSEWMDNGSLKDLIQTKQLYQGSEKEIIVRIIDISGPPASRRTKRYFPYPVSYGTVQ